MDKSSPTSWGPWVVGAAAAATVPQPNVNIGYPDMTTPNSAPQQAQASHATHEAISYVVDAKLEAAEARLELKIVDRFKGVSDQLNALIKKIDGVDGKFGPLETKIDAKPGTWTLVGAIVGSVLAGFGAILGVLSYAGDRFDGGMSAAGALAQQNVEQTETLKSIDERLRDMEEANDQPKASDPAKPD